MLCYDKIFHCHQKAMQPERIGGRKGKKKKEKESKEINACLQ